MTISANPGDEVTFQLVNTSIVGTSFANCKVQGTVSYEAARFIDSEIASKHNNLYPYFAAAVNNVSDPSSYNYLIVMTTAGKAEVVGIPWILESSFTTVGSQTGTIVITGYQAKYTDSIKDLLANLGASYTLTIV